LLKTLYISTTITYLGIPNMKILTCSLLLILPFLLVACGPPLVFGVPQEQWNQLNQQQRNKVIEGYNQRKQIQAQVAPLNAAIDALSAKN
jgi:hypothetical protein